jgi:hypothetical protein
VPRRIVSEPGEAFYRVRVVLPGALFNLASRTPPVVHQKAGRVTKVVAEWLTDPEQGDTVGFIDWTAVVAVTWRWSGAGSPPENRWGAVGGRVMGAHVARQSAEGPCRLLPC